MHAGRKPVYRAGIRASHNDILTLAEEILLIQQTYYLQPPNILIMQRSMGLLLVLGIILICGVFVIADSLSVVQKEGGSMETTQTGEVVDGSMQGEILVRFNPELWNMTALQSAANASHAYIGATVKTDYDELGLPGLQLVQLPPGMTLEESIAYYQSLPYVKYAERNVVYSIESDTGSNDGVNGTPDTGALAQNGTSKNPVRLLVQFDVKAFSDAANLSAYANQTHAALNATLLKDFTMDGLSGLHLVELSGNMTPSEGVQAYKNQTSVIYAEPDYEIRLSEPVRK